MSTVLTNGVIIPDNGSRNWGGDLANNWNILDVHVGYMNDVKNRVTTLENSVAENTANIQTNASNISALQTSKQDAIEDLETIRTGASAGATAVQPSVLSNYVDLSSDQTIVGVKKFSGILVGIDNFNIQGGSDWDGGARLTLNKKTESMSAILQTFSNADNSAYVYDINNFYPYTNNKNNLGTSSNKWKTFNGINPGALSLPDHNSYLDVTGNLPASVSDNLWISRYQITPEQDGILILNFNDCAAVVVWSNSNLPSYGDRGTSICNEKRVMAFLLKGATYNVYTNNYSQVALARLFYCQGNV